MSASERPVPQQAVDAAQEALDAHGVFVDGPARVLCDCRSHWMTPAKHREHVAVEVAAAVVAAVQRPLQARALRTEAEAWRTEPYRSLSFSGALIAINIDASADEAGDQGVSPS